ncbi:hypothetical protein EPI10_033070 [Gossypium australe]|uniref:Uncharacterized protein n=1 Tax=Gossypium australe TaxID=47621 RepID=A0A5B6X849_9ROSI|nr:hypothetical protein EPI10_033070 [Gossypium australe]
MIENAIKCNKIEAGEGARKTIPKKRENDVNNLSVHNKSYSKPIAVSQPKTVITDNQNPSRQESNAKQNTEKLQFTPIPMTYRELYQNLFDAHVVSLHYLKPLQPSYLKWLAHNDWLRIAFVTDTYHDSVGSYVSYMSIVLHKGLC